MASRGCSVKGCTKRELVPFKCAGCGLNHCLKHRVKEDHKCDPTAAVRDRRANYFARAIPAH